VDDGQSFVVEMNEAVWARFVADTRDVTPEEADWRPLPQANSINVILRHVRIEAEWHLASLEHGAAMPEDVTPEQQREIDAVPIDFERNSRELAGLVTQFLTLLRRTPFATLQARTGRAYGANLRAASIPPHFLGFHQATHLANHLGQIRTLRNLYRKTRGEAARFHPGNPTYPR
jgi:hypothetical protein